MAFWFVGSDNFAGLWLIMIALINGGTSSIQKMPIIFSIKISEYQ